MSIYLFVNLSVYLFDNIFLSKIFKTNNYLSTFCWSNYTMLLITNLITFILNLHAISIFRKIVYQIYQFLVAKNIMFLGGQRSGHSSTGKIISKKLFRNRSKSSNRNTFNILHKSGALPCKMINLWLLKLFFWGGRVSYFEPLRGPILISFLTLQGKANLYLTLPDLK